MSRLLCCVALVCVALFTSSEADARRRDRPATTTSSGPGLRPPGGPLGLGLNLGWPTGLAGKYYLTNDQGLTFGLGFGGASVLGGYLDYVWAPTALVNIAPGTLYPYIGGGVFVGIFPLYYGNPFGRFVAFPFVLGAEIPLGLAWNFAALPVDIYLELAPGIAVLPGLDFGIRGSLGFRYYF